VCGHAQLPWDRFAHSVIFLASICPTIATLPWVDIVFIRDLHRAGFNHTTDYNCRLLVYCEFCCSVRTMYRRCNTLGLGLVLGAYTIKVSLVFYMPLNPLQLLVLVLALLPADLFLLWVLLPGLAPNPGYADIIMHQGLRKVSPDTMG
jgi:hypothetical protein